MFSLFDPSASPGDSILGTLSSSTITATNISFAKLFNFGALYAGVIVEVQALQIVGNSFIPLTPYSSVGVCEAGAGQYGAIFLLPFAFIGFVRARIQSLPLIVDTYEVNLGATLDVSGNVTTTNPATTINILPQSISPLNVISSSTSDSILQVIGS